LHTNLAKSQRRRG